MFIQLRISAFQNIIIYKLLASLSPRNAFLPEIGIFVHVTNIVSGE